MSPNITIKEILNCELINKKEKSGDEFARKQKKTNGVKQNSGKKWY